MKLKHINQIYFLTLTIIVISTTGCRKQDEFLDAKPNAALAVPSTLNDLQLILQDESLFNQNDPALNQIGSDDYYDNPTILNSFSSTEINGYLWNPKVYDAGSNLLDWTSPYLQVYYANVILDAIQKINLSTSERVKSNNIKGSALFYRSIAFYNLLQTFSTPYNLSTSANDLGIPLRLNSNINDKSTRPSQKQCYSQIISDILAALPLLPVNPIYKTQPSQGAANGLLARIYLTMNDYVQAGKYADACIKQSPGLTNYNTLKPATRALSTDYLGEDIFHSRMISYSINSSNSKSFADTILYQSYTTNDLRKSLFFIINAGRPFFRGTYDFKRYLFSGIATDEIYLIRAECYARVGDIENSMKDLNSLLVKRWKTGTFLPYLASSADDALNQVLKERRKELIFRGQRWQDLRRLNQDTRFAVTLTRNINSLVYSLPPKDNRYTWPIPDNEIQSSGIQQNPR